MIPYFYQWPSSTERKMADRLSWASIYFYQDTLMSLLFKDGNEIPARHTGCHSVILCSIVNLRENCIEIFISITPLKGNQWNLRTAQLLDRWSTKRQQQQKNLKEPYLSSDLTFRSSLPVKAKGCFNAQTLKHTREMNAFKGMRLFFFFYINVIHKQVM